MAKKKPKPSGPKGAPEWVVTFTDMISLLVTFFVLLMTFSSLEEYDLLKVEAWLSGNVGIMKNRGQALVDMPEEDFQTASDTRRGAMNPHDRPAHELEKNLAEMGQRRRAGDQEVSFANVDDGLVIDFGPAGIFAPGSADVRPVLRKTLGEVARTLEAYPHLVVVEGPPDAEFTPTPEFPTADELAFARASTCAEIMRGASDLPAARMQVVGRHPAPERAGVASRSPANDRGLQVRVLTLSKLRASFAEGR